MRRDGLLRRWDDARGFGFIAPTHGGAELFVHISAFGRGAGRPVEGEAVSFELGRGPNGKPQAVRVVRKALGERPAAGAALAQPPHRAWSSGLGRLLKLALALGIAGAVATWGHGRYQAAAQRHRLELLPPVAAPADTPPSPAGYRCDGRAHCSQMTSCAEATWFIHHCPGTQMDGDHDGVPCEQQWCTGPGAR